MTRTANRSVTTYRSASLFWLGAVLLGWTAPAVSAAITHDPDRKVVVMSDAIGSLVQG